MPDLLKITVKPPFRDLHGRFSKADKAMLESKRDQIRLLGKHYVEIARQEAPKRTGAFAKSIGFRTFIKGQTVGFTTHSKQPLGTFITEGTKPHIIRARKSVLYFFWPNGPRGARYYAFSFVHHPGTQPNPYHERAYQQWRPEGQAALRRIARSYIMALQGK